jgi:protein O-mannosyl-transferase
MLTTAPEAIARRSKLWICLALVAVTLSVYWPLTRAEFITYDDVDYVVQNNHIGQGLSWQGFLWAFHSGTCGNWHPLTWLSHMLDVQLFGVQPGPHHLVNLLFHIANTLLLFLLFQKLTGALWRSAFVAALFAVHPLHVESVAWVAERKDVLSTFFGLLSIGAYAGYAGKAQGQRPGSEVQGSKSVIRGPWSAVGGFSSLRQLPASCFYTLSVALFALSLMSKPMLVTLPFLLLLLDYWPLGRFQLNAQNATLKALFPLLREKLPYLALATASSAITVATQNQGHALLSVEAIPIGPRIANALVSYVRYIGKALWPSHLALPYPYPGGWPVVTLLLAAAVLAIASFVALRLARRRPYLAVGWFWFVGTLVPVIGLVQVGSQAMADRYTYLPLIGLFLLSAWLVPDWLRNWRYREVTLATVGAAVLLVFVWRARVQAGYWKDSVTLFRHSLAVTSDNAMAHASLGTALLNQERLADALAEFSRALTLKPTFAKPLGDMAQVLCSEGRLDEAATLFRKILEARPNDSEACLKLSSVLASQGRLDEAAALCQQVLQVNPGHRQARTNLEAILAQRRLELHPSEHASPNL